jgi:hypothetical protein
MLVGRVQAMQCQSQDYVECHSLVRSPSSVDDVRARQAHRPPDVFPMLCCAGAMRAMVLLAVANANASGNAVFSLRRCAGRI